MACLIHLNYDSKGFFDGHDCVYSGFIDFMRLSFLGKIHYIYEFIVSYRLYFELLYLALRNSFLLVFLHEVMYFALFQVIIIIDYYFGGYY